MADTPRATVPSSPAALPSVVLRGTPVSPGLALGPARRQGYDLHRVPMRRVPRDQVEDELNRFHAALSTSRRQLDDLRAQLANAVPDDHARVIDTHLAYLKDSVFLSDVENLILGEQLALESAIAKVILDFDRIFRLVENELLRERAVDLRDVGIRVLRNLELARSAEEAGGGAPADPGDYVLVARELSIVDMFNIDNRHVLAILTEAGTLTSRAAILARSMRIPTLTAVDGLLDEVAEGDFLIVDATEGSVRVRPEPLVREQFRRAEAEAAGAAEDRLPPARTACGRAVSVTGACGNLSEVEAAVRAGVEGVGLYRTELLFLVDREPPSLAALTAHYQSVLRSAGEGGATFRLLDVDSGSGLSYLFESREPNPQLGRLGVRALLARDSVLRRQLQAILRAAAATGRPARVAVPKLTDCGELRRVREVLFEERLALKKGGGPPGGRLGEQLEVGAVIETPAAALGARALAAESDFVTVGLDSLQQYLLAADRDNVALAATFERLHPVAARVLQDVVAACSAEETPMSVFGVTAASEANLGLLLGAGFTSFVVAPVLLRGFVDALARVSLDDAARAAAAARRAITAEDLGTELRGYGRG